MDLNNRKRHLVIAGIVGIAMLTGLGAVFAQPAKGGSANVIKLSLKKFEFAPSSITVHKGVPVVIELTSTDTTHGFNLPDFGVRADVKKGAVSRVEFTPNKTGKFTFYCDVFCGGGHEDMSGTLTVAE